MIRALFASADLRAVGDSCLLVSQMLNRDFFGTGMPTAVRTRPPPAARSLRCDVFDVLVGLLGSFSAC